MNQLYYLITLACTTLPLTAAYALNEEITKVNDLLNGCILALSDIQCYHQEYGLKEAPKLVTWQKKINYLTKYSLYLSNTMMVESCFSELKELYIDMYQGYPKAVTFPAELIQGPPIEYKINTNKKRLPYGLRHRGPKATK